MEFRSGPRELLALDDHGGPDRISALPDELLLLVLGRLPCAATAARTGVLSRRWRGLWPRLRRIVLSDVALQSVEAALARFPPPPPAVPLLQIHISKGWQSVNIKQRTPVVTSLLRAAARLDPEQLSLDLPDRFVGGCPHFELPSFRRATSIALDLCSLIRIVPVGAEFPALETLSLSQCTADLDALLSRCPRLRTLRLDRFWLPKCSLSVTSPLLEELVVARLTKINRVNIAAPLLKQLTLSLQSYTTFSISISAPMLEKLSWDCYFFERSSTFGLWWLQRLSLPAAQTPSLHIHACISSSAAHGGQLANYTKDIEKRLIAAFSGLELHLDTKGHVYGAFVAHVLETDRIRCDIQRLKVHVQRSVKMEEEGCPLGCPCEPADWKSQTISLTALEEVEISGFGGKDHDLDMLKLILRSAPMLKSMNLKLSQEASASNDGCTKIYDIFQAYPSVQCYVYLSSGLMHGSPNCPST